MIRMFNSKNGRVGSHKTFEEVCDHFRRVEHLKPSLEEIPCGTDRWDFVYWPHKRLSSVHEHPNNFQFSQAEREAYENDLDLIEIFDGRSESADQYVVTPDLDIDSLMREWCFDYAYSHGYTILETLSGELPGTPLPTTHSSLQGLVYCGVP